MIPHGAYIVSMCHNYAVAHACAEEIPSNNYLFMVGAANGEVDPKVALKEVESKGMYAVVCKYMIAYFYAVPCPTTIIIYTLRLMFLSHSLLKMVFTRN